ncbi:MAG: hypothetical protein QXJ74_08240 [Nitrososphaera sp.]|uniref:hypothetical protein n=1 Tax=Nitrososphaera sp. TaxID=1971748 RepID=UPI0018549943|nr:hypothetical protein [Nitrososphaera sp.]NWG36169.1 hypothetical protein [Nitrososphaera sp.]
MRKALIIAGIAIVAGVAILVALTWGGYLTKALTGAPENPVVYLVVDGERYASDNNFYCPNDCDFLTIARVFSSPPIEIPRGSEAAFEIDYRAISTQYALFEYGPVENDDRFRQSDKQLNFDENGRLVIDWPKGRYVLAVTTGWNSVDENQSYSLHRFRITVT